MGCSAAEAGAGIEGGEAVGLGLRGGDDLPDIDAHAVAELRELVHETDVDITVGVLEDLLHLGNRRAGDTRHAALEDRLVHGGDKIERLVSDSSDNLGGVLSLVDQVARIDALGEKPR